MSACEYNLDALLLLMNQAHDTCVMLQNYSDENYHVFQSGDDEKIFEVISNREKIIESLADIENKIDALLDEAAKSVHGKSLLAKAEALRLSIRSILNDIAVRDIEIMKTISSRMHAYKIEILKARNKMNLSAYMRNAAMQAYDDSNGVDLIK